MMLSKEGKALGWTSVNSPKNARGRNCILPRYRSHEFDVAVVTGHRHMNPACLLSDHLRTVIENRHATWGVYFGQALRLSKLFLGRRTALLPRQGSLAP